MIGALNIAAQAHLALEHWEPALDRIGEMSAVKRARGASEHEIAIDRFNRYHPLLALGRLAEAQRELEYCLEVFGAAEDHAGRGRVLSGLADLSAMKGDLAHAVALQRRALALR
ncbi:MAG TPA: hypothetical protein VF179_20405, partial [Thermoanaerobaculia bacterium]|nr:hypothetical protein [Thermoanaerobaculia bacterium]